MVIGPVIERLQELDKSERERLIRKNENKQKIKENDLVKVVCLNWSNYDGSTGKTIDGVSLHPNRSDAIKYIRAHKRKRYGTESLFEERLKRETIHPAYVSEGIYSKMMDTNEHKLMINMPYLEKLVAGNSLVFN